MSIRKCGCGCGTNTKRRWAIGHDGRFKSMLIQAHSAHQPIAHPDTGDDMDALVIAKFLDDERGGGTFWFDTVIKGAAKHSIKRTKQERRRKEHPSPAEREARLERIMADNLRPHTGEYGDIVRKGKTHPVRILKVIRDTEPWTLEVLSLNSSARYNDVPETDFTKTNGGRPW